MHDEQDGLVGKVPQYTKPVLTSITRSHIKAYMYVCSCIHTSHIYRVINNKIQKTMRGLERRLSV